MGEGTRDYPPSRPGVVSTPSMTKSKKQPEDDQHGEYLNVRMSRHVFRLLVAVVIGLLAVGLGINPAELLALGR